MGLYQDAKTIVANVVGTLIDPGYPFRFWVQNNTAADVWISQTNPPALSPPSILVPKANANGPSMLGIDTDTPGPWYYKSTVAGLLGVFWTPAS